MPRTTASSFCSGSNVHDFFEFSKNRNPPVTRNVEKQIWRAIVSSSIFENVKTFLIKIDTILLPNPEVTSFNQIKELIWKSNLKINQFVQKYNVSNLICCHLSSPNCSKLNCQNNLHFRYYQGDPIKIDWNPYHT